MDFYLWIEGVINERSYCIVLLHTPKTLKSAQADKKNSFEWIEEIVTFGVVRDNVQ